MANEGVIKYACNHTYRSLTPGEQAAYPDLSRWRKVFRQRQLLGSDPSRYDGLGYGNLSARLPNATFIITGSQTAIEECFERDGLALVTCVDLPANALTSFGETRPSSEALTHAALYAADPSIWFVFHAHCPLIWHRQQQLHLAATDESTSYGTLAMAREVSALYAMNSRLRETKILVMKGHEDGVITFGRTAEEAGEAMCEWQDRAGIVEHEGAT